MKWMSVAWTSAGRQGECTQDMSIEVSEQVHGFRGWHHVYKRHNLIPNDMFWITACRWYAYVQHMQHHARLCSHLRIKHVLSMLCLQNCNPRGYQHSQPTTLFALTGIVLHSHSRWWCDGGNLGLLETYDWNCLVAVLCKHIHAIVKLAIAQAVNIVAHYAEVSLPSAPCETYVHASPLNPLPACHVTAKWALCR